MHGLARPTSVGALGNGRLRAWIEFSSRYMRLAGVQLAVYNGAAISSHYKGMQTLLRTQR